MKIEMNNTIVVQLDNNENRAFLQMDKTQIGNGDI